MEKLKLIASFLMVASGASLATKLPFFEYAFIGFFIGHTIMAYVLFKMKEPSMFAANFFFWTVDGIGIYRWVI